MALRAVFKIVVVLQNECCCWGDPCVVVYSLDIVIVWICADGLVGWVEGEVCLLVCGGMHCEGVLVSAFLERVCVYEA